MRLVVLTVLTITLVGILVYIDWSAKDFREFLRPDMLDYVERLLTPPPPKPPERIIADPTQALVDAYAANRLTVEEFEHALEKVRA